MNSLRPAPAATFLDGAVQPGAIGAWECNLANNALTWTDGVYDLFGLRRGSEIYRSSTLDLYEESSRREMERLRASAIREGRGFALDCRIVTAAGEKRWMRLVVGVGHQNGRPFRIFGSKQDITAEKELWTGLSARARGEPLTSVTARSGLGDALRHVQPGHDAASARIALVIFSIDGFGPLLDRFGKVSGGVLERCLAERLKRVFPDSLSIEKAGEGSFTVLLRMPGDRRHLQAALNGMRPLLCRPVPHGALVLDFTLSIGASLGTPERCRAPQELLAEAEAALLVAGTAGGNCVNIFDGPIARPRFAGSSAPA
ncbi:diguanylate cyclase domain-containing protein [Bosea sp. BH3]|uniref:diguanylate cyclase domain-containing protein n=1 Tax=Bosea sp. BH3 TaxID=2871701 RepID=UPI0021CAE5AF|nr:diguanylate cyclase [Bosea sp. BH3]MCU4180772.1 diguanylate cyclase [Bosea sp. BH3]